MINTVKFADPTSQGSLHQIIGWIDFGPNFELKNGIPQNITNILPDCYRIDATLLFSSPDQNLSLISVPVPIVNATPLPFSNRAYSGICGNSALYYSIDSASTSSLLISNISVTKIDCCTQCSCPCFSLIVADAEITTTGEFTQATTNGTPWIFIKNIVSSTGITAQGPVFSGIGTQSISEQGTSTSIENITAGVFLTINPSSISFTFTTNNSKSGVALGAIVNHTPTYNNI